MKILTLQIKRQYLDEILAGTKPEDLQKILEAFPASEKLLFDHDQKKLREDGKKG